MTYRKLSLTGLFLLSMGWAGLFAQETVLSSGGDATSVGGASASYSIGQPVYTTIVGSGGTSAQGVQQAWEISVVTGFEEYGIQLEVSTYPNPVKNNLTLDVDYSTTEKLTYELLDLNGKLLDDNSLEEGKATIQMESRASGIYIIRVYAGQNNLKSFKIVKN